MLTSKITKRIEIPGEPGMWVQVVRLGWRAKREASQANSDEMFAMVKSIGSPMLLQEFMKLMQEQAEQVEEFRKKAQAKNPLAGYDIGVVLRKGVQKWSYSDRVKPEEIDDQDADWARLVATEIMELSKERSEEEQKNDSSGSIAISTD